MRNCSINRAIRRELIIRQNDKIQINPNQYRDICRKGGKEKKNINRVFRKVEKCHRDVNQQEPCKEIFCHKGFW